MADPPTNYQQLLERITTWVLARSDIRAAAEIGSQARTNTPPDEWGDLDIALLVVEAAPYLRGEAWLSDIGDYWCTHVERTEMSAGLQRRAVFANGLNVDFVFYELPELETLFSSENQSAELASSMIRGFRVLVDKDNIVETATKQLQNSAIVRYKLPEVGELNSLISQFWYYAVWTAKHIMREELWRAHTVGDAALKRLLLQLMEWHARAVHGEEYDTWSNGRFLEQWADAHVVEAVGKTFARHNRDELIRALHATTELFHELAAETAKQLGYSHLIQQDEAILNWIRELTAPKHEGG